MSGVTFFFLVLTCFSAAQEQGALGLRLLDLKSAPPPIRKTNLCFGKYHWIDPRGTRSIIFSLGWLVSRFKVIEPFSLTDCPFMRLSTTNDISCPDFGPSGPWMCMKYLNLNRSFRGYRVPLLCLHKEHEVTCPIDITCRYGSSTT